MQYRIRYLFWTRRIAIIQKQIKVMPIGGGGEEKVPRVSFKDFKISYFFFGILSGKNVQMFFFILLLSFKKSV